MDRRSTSLSHAVVRLFRLVNRATNRAVAELGLSGEQAHVLVALWEMGPVTVGALQRELALSSATLTGAIDRMVASELVRRVPAPDDRRASLIEARVPAKRRDQVQDAVDRSDETCFAALTGAERKELLRLLGKCAADLEPEPRR
jgi:DNA-binding MarR family transcriptional regulator